MQVFDWTNKINKNELKEVINALNNDKLIVFPTETVYGIGGNALKLDVVDKIYQAKNRDYSKPFTLMVNNISKIKDIAYVSDYEEKIINNFMPGPITLILKKKDCISNLVTSGKDTVGIRIPNHDVSLSILNSINYIPDSLYIEVLSIDKTGLLYYIDILADHISANLNFCNINHSRLKLIEFLQSSVRTSSNIISINDLHLKRPITLE